ncbi:beta-lactamase-like protein [Chaetomium sp. MPI-CAGE-AT-0009]|nr:beta-lactamase-like protein [Chaetomium sp. MPI-CAGE-AT-0009]
MRLHPAGPLLQPLLRLKPLNKMSTQPQPQLPPLPEVERLAPGCIRILGGNPGKFTLQGTNTYLVGTGASRILIDTGEGRASWVAALRRVLQEERATIGAALLTHWHRDHTGGVADLLAAWPGTPVHKHQPEPEESGWAGLADGQTFRVDGATLTAAHTPGHTADHMVLYWAEQGALFTGDNVLGHGTSVFEDLAAYVSSLERMRGLYGDREGAGRQRPTRATGPRRSVRLRATRKRLLWKRGLVRSIYQNVPETLHPAAAGGVVQILQKLKREGRVVEVDDGERWRLAPGSGRSAL